MVTAGVRRVWTGILSPVVSDDLRGQPLEISSRQVVFVCRGR